METLFTGCLAGMYCARVDQDHAARGSEMFFTFMGKGLEPSFDQPDDVVIVTVARIGMVNVKSLQKLHGKLGVIPDLRPFLSCHNRSKKYTSKITSVRD